MADSILEHNPRAAPGLDPSRRGMFEHPRHWGRAYRGGKLVCDRLLVAIGRDDERLGLAPRERRRFEARFLEGVDVVLHRELAELVRRRGMAARRVAERLEPIEIVIDDPRQGRRWMVGRLEPPLLRCGELREIEFGLREVGTP